MKRKIFALAVPNIISNITIPLVGMVDLAIVGVMGSVDLLGGIAIGTAIFNLLYWNFGFLRMGTSGLAAQAYGRRDFDEVRRILIRSLIVAATIGSWMLIAQTPMLNATLLFMDGTPQVESHAADYFKLRIWAAPATLALYAFKGWFIGMQNARTPMWIAIVINMVNIIFSLFFAFTLDMGLPGVALGTAIAQWAGAGLATWCVVRYYGRFFEGRKLFEGVFSLAAFKQFFRLNGDIFIRTLCLVAVFTYFTKASSSLGTIVLAANTLLMQLFTLFSYFMDGFAYAGEALTGRYTGSGNVAMRRASIFAIFRVGAVVSIIFSLAYFFGGEAILGLFNPTLDVLLAAGEMMIFASLVPILGFMAFLMDGILVGMTLSGVMRNSMLIATALFFGLYFSILPALGPASLWVSFLSYLFARGAIQLLLSSRHIFVVQTIKIKTPL